MSDDNRQPWDKRDDEPPEAYARFLTYRNLGPGRTLVLAEEVNGGTTKRKKTPSGHWSDESARYEWRDRSIAWDINQLSRWGEELARLWIGILISVATKASQKLADPKCRPSTFVQCVTVIEKLSPFLTPEVVARLVPQPPALATDDGGFIPFSREAKA